MGYWFKSNKKPQNEIDRNLRLLNVEQEIKDSKLQLIAQIAKQHGMHGIELASFLTSIDASKLGTPTNDIERIIELIYITKHILGDDFMDDEEFDFATDVAHMIGFERALCPHIIKEIYESLKIEESDEKIIADVTALINKRRR